MKRWIAMLLIMVMLLCLCSCGKQEQPDMPKLKVGFGKACFTPKVPYPLTNSEEDTYEAVWDDVYASCIAVTDEAENTLLLVTVDLQHTSDNSFNQLIRAAAKAANVPEENVLVTTTHAHASLDPVMASTLISNAVKECAAAAMSDRQPAHMYSGTVYPKSLNFIRHYQMDDGSWVGDAYGFTNAKVYVGHERDADNAMQLVRFQREGHKDVLLVNWQAHANYANQNQLSADFIGSFRDTVEEKLGCHVAFYQGAAGNVNPWSRLEGKNLTQDQKEKSLEGMKEHGKLLAQYAIDGFETLEKRNPGQLKIKTETYVAKVEDVTQELLDAVTKFKEATANGASRAAAAQAAGGLINSTSACAAVDLRILYGEKKEMQIKAVSLGELGFIAAPYEMFDTQGMFIKENSPFKMTVIVGYCNGRNGYIPSQECIDHGCYEGENRYFVEGTAEELANQYVAMLKELHG